MKIYRFVEEVQEKGIFTIQQVIEEESFTRTWNGKTPPQSSEPTYRFFLREKLHHPASSSSLTLNQIRLLK